MVTMFYDLIIEGEGWINMNKIAVVYKSKYGSTKKYAEWISDALTCDLFDARKVDAKTLSKYDVIVYGGGLYASGINGISLITKNIDALKGRKIIVFTVGLADPKIESQFQPIIDKNFTGEMKACIEIFHLRGGIDYKNISVVHKSMMAMVKKMVDKKPEDEKTDEDKMMVETYGTIVDFTDQEAIMPILSSVREGH